MAKTSWLRLLGYLSGMVNQELLLKNEFLVAENRILKAHIESRLLLSNGEKATLAEIAKRLGRKAIAQIACVAKPDTILAWYRKLVAKKFDGSKQRAALGRPRIGRELEDLVVQLAQSNSGWGYDRIVGALANLGHSLSDQTVGNILRRRGIQPTTERRNNTTWKDFIPFAHERPGCYRLLHGRSADVARTGNVLRIVFHPSGHPSCFDCRHHLASRWCLDGTDRTQRHLGELGIPPKPPLPAPRSVLPQLAVVGFLVTCSCVMV
ncbi:MAG: helix-turn-helix domain-containing protein [Acidobacteria bacterium]|nr:helix-turn-helix domain-containing protein [Acidobacteriota bacterium]